MIFMESFSNAIKMFAYHGFSCHLLQGLYYSQTWHRVGFSDLLGLPVLTKLGPQVPRSLLLIIPIEQQRKDVKMDRMCGHVTSQAPHSNNLTLL